MKYSAVVRVPAALTALMSAVPVDEASPSGDVLPPPQVTCGLGLTDLEGSLISLE